MEVSFSWTMATLILSSQIDLSKIYCTNHYNISSISSMVSLKMRFYELIPDRDVDLVDEHSS